MGVGLRRRRWFDNKYPEWIREDWPFTLPDGRSVKFTIEEHKNVEQLLTKLTVIWAHTGGEEPVPMVTHIEVPDEWMEDLEAFESPDPSHGVMAQIVDVAIGQYANLNYDNLVSYQDGKKLKGNVVIPWVEATKKGKPFRLLGSYEVQAVLNGHVEGEISG